MVVAFVPTSPSQPSIRCFAYMIRTHPVKVSWLKYNSHRFFFFFFFLYMSAKIWKSCPWAKSIRPSLSHFEEYSKFFELCRKKSPEAIVHWECGHRKNCGHVVVLYLLGHSTLGVHSRSLDCFWHLCLMLELMLDFPPIWWFWSTQFYFLKEKGNEIYTTNMSVRRDVFCWGTPYKGQVILSLIL